MTGKVWLATSFHRNYSQQVLYFMVFHKMPIFHMLAYLYKVILHGVVRFTTLKCFLFWPN